MKGAQSVVQRASFCLTWWKRGQNEMLQNRKNSLQSRICHLWLECRACTWNITTTDYDVKTEDFQWRKSNITDASLASGHIVSILVVCIWIIWNAYAENRHQSAPVNRPPLRGTLRLQPHLSCDAIKATLTAFELECREIAHVIADFSPPFTKVYDCIQCSLHQMQPALRLYMVVDPINIAASLYPQRINRAA